MCFVLDRDSDGYNVFTIDPITGMIRTKAVLDHEERNVYRVSVKATDAGRPPRHSVRALRVEVLALADNRPTFTSSSLTFNVSTNDPGHPVGFICSLDSFASASLNAIGPRVRHSAPSPPLLSFCNYSLERAYEL